MSANSERAEDEMAGQHPIWLFWVGIVALAALWWLNRQIAQRFHRRLNVGLAAAAVAVAVLTLAAAVLAQNQSGDNDDLVDGTYQDAVDGAAVRTLANDAKANESLLLVKRGSGQDVRGCLGRGGRPGRGPGHRRDARPHGSGTPRCTARSSSWTPAATGTPPSRRPPRGATTAPPRRWTSSTGRHRPTSTRRLRRPPTRCGQDVAFALVLAISTLLLGLVAAALCAWGINQRRKEYA